jgi:hypothetical protein
MRIGYARVSTNEQQPVSQTDALTEAGCKRIYTETASGARRDRPELTRAPALVPGHMRVAETTSAAPIDTPVSVVPHVAYQLRLW